MGLTQIHLKLYSVAVFCVIALTYVSGDDVILQKRLEKNGVDPEQFMDRPIKRPFCNAFTGCGKKKRWDESMATLVELNSEPAVEELTRQILSEAKLWEAIQEARSELERRRSERQKMLDASIPLAFAMSRMKSRNPHGESSMERKIANELEQYNRRR